jgi:hypothetical protein
MSHIQVPSVGRSGHARQSEPYCVQRRGMSLGGLTGARRRWMEDLPFVDNRRGRCQRWWSMQIGRWQCRRSRRRRRRTARCRSDGTLPVWSVQILVARVRPAAGIHHTTVISAPPKGSLCGGRRPGQAHARKRMQQPELVLVFHAAIGRKQRFRRARRRRVPEAKDALRLRTSVLFAVTNRMWQLASAQGLAHVWSALRQSAEHVFSSGINSFASCAHEVRT